MSRHAARARAGESRANLYDEITDKIIAELETGRVPWVQPWGTAAAKAPLAMPKNASTGRQYSGVNVLILWGAVIEHGLTGQTGSRSARRCRSGAMFAKVSAGRPSSMPTALSRTMRRSRAAESGEEAQAIPFLKRFTVFNTDQCDDLPTEIATAVPPPLPGLIEPPVEALIKATGIDFRIGGNSAFYIPSEDFVQVPPPAAYFEPINWHRTALHELGHASGHRSRLNRDLSGSHGSKKYTFKELIAELCAAFSCASSASCRRCGTPIISARGSTYCMRTTARSCAPRRKPAKRPSGCSASFQNRLRAPPLISPAEIRRPRDGRALSAARE
jgi:antirestriction protein ArdC